MKPCNPKSISSPYEAVLGILGSDPVRTKKLDQITAQYLEEQLKDKPTPMPRVFTLGYGGRKPDELTALIRDRGIKTVVDVRLRPDRAAMGVYQKAKTPEKGIEKLLRDTGSTYVWLAELGNLFVGLDDWEARYSRLLEKAGDLLVERLIPLAGPVCLLCCEKDPAHCHRRLIAEFLARRGYAIEHIL
jgi:uncharacterized protein (DUF488 family)